MSALSLILAKCFICSRGEFINFETRKQLYSFRKSKDMAENCNEPNLLFVMRSVGN